MKGVWEMGGLVLGGLAFSAAGRPPCDPREEEMCFLVAEAQPEVGGPQLPGPAAPRLQGIKTPGAS